MSKANTNLVLLASFIVMTITGTVSAADLIVQESGPVGTYTSIGAAVAASTDGDRIIINNTVSGFPWTEDILINKTLTFLSAVDNQRFTVQGNYTIQHAPGREVTIIGMDNVAGSISSIANGATARTIVNVMWCKLTLGSVNLNHDYFELNLASSTILGGGDVSFKYGKVIGNQFSNGGYISLSTDALAGTDSVHVVGNTGVTSISCGSASHYLYVSNNSLATSSYVNGIYIGSLKVGAGTNVVRNNSIRVNGYAIRVNTGVGGKLLIYNNILVDYSAADYGISIGSVSLSNLIVSYNFIDNSFDNGTLIGVTNDGTNLISSSVNLNGDGSSAWTGTIDGGNPGTADYDLDLTRNDPGAFGGSYSLDNFFPIDGTSSKVFYLQMPSEILVGGSNSVTGHSFDR
ncbi:MAG: hypothetical protein HRT58_02270 [Crocinitomicaceae bacterium]|nr:hypothetical protein [Flavobacteriales bacterium]NQZ34453.1 hypothetical protein [Crocinitomicaceae bacterium]